ncbi:MAG TPA: flagellar basal body rod protein FlgB [Acidobacteriota bacterium]|nr:flagellar basal body rod protein FlgB [Acidobacteriota bacterium]
MPGAIQRVIFDQTAIPRLERALDLTAARHKLLTQNVANAETPGYVRKDIDFASELRASMGSASSTGVRTTRPGHMTGQSRVHACKVIKERPAQGEATSVELDQEMARMAENQLEYNISAHLARGKFETLKLAIRGGR